MPRLRSSQDIEDCLIALYFGRGDDPLRLCMDRAYGDFKRRLGGIADSPRGKEARIAADKNLTERFSTVREIKPATQSQFDDWHQDACRRLSDIYKEFGYKSFLVGHAQKWLNMTFKYIFLMGERRVPGFDHLYGVCHVPLDRILMGSLRNYDFPPLPCAWSKLDDYQIYLDRQHWVRRRFSFAPLDVEFLLWMGKPLPSEALSGCSPRS